MLPARLLGGGRKLRYGWIAPAVVAAAVALALLDAESGVPTWLRLGRDLEAAHARIAVLRSEIEAAEAEADALREDPFAIESAIRRDLLLARPGETVVRLAPPGAPSLRIP